MGICAESCITFYCPISFLDHNESPVFTNSHGISIGDITRGQWPYKPASTRITSKVKSDLGYEISDLNYLRIHVHFAYTGLGPLLLVASEANTASK